MMEDIIVYALVVILSIAITLAIHFYAIGSNKQDEIDMLREEIKKREDGAFYSVHFKGKDIDISDNILNETIYKIKWKRKQYNGTYNSMMIDYNGLDPETWYVLQLRTAYDVWMREVHGNSN
jgi:hypothetical protein